MSEATDEEAAAVAAVAADLAELSRAYACAVAAERLAALRTHGPARTSREAERERLRNHAAGLFAAAAVGARWAATQSVEPPPSPIGPWPTR